MTLLKKKNEVRAVDPGDRRRDKNSRPGALSHLQRIMFITLIASSFLSIGLTTGFSTWTWFFLGTCLAAASPIALWKYGITVANVVQGATVVTTLAAITLVFLFSVLRSDIHGSTSIPSNIVTLILAIALSFGYGLVRHENRAVSSRESSLAGVRHSLGGPSLVLSFCVAAFTCAFILLVLTAGEENLGLIAFFQEKILKRGIIPPICLVLFNWGAMILLGKAIDLWREDRALTLALTLDKKDRRIPKSCLITHFIHRDASMDQESHQQPLTENEINEYCEMIWQVVEGSYILIHYIAWAIPILGFIGTVFGISQSVSELGLLMVSSDASVISQALGEAIAPLGLAFDTTLIALSLSILLVFAQTMLQRWESRFLNNFEFLILRESKSDNDLAESQAVKSSAVAEEGTLVNIFKNA